MAGGYTHLTIVNVSAERNSLSAIESFPPEAIIACGMFRKFCDLGAVSPDYPYLNVLSERSKRWADLMHYRGTGDFIKLIVRQIRDGDRGRARKCLAWLMGYTSHVVADVSIHPVVNLRVGPYAENKTEHRLCEMNQDVFIFEKRMGLEIAYAEFLKSGVGACVDERDNFDAEIADLWKSGLRHVHPIEYADNEPDPSIWHRSFRTIVDGIAENRILSKISRHVAPGIGFSYPRNDEIDRSYIDNLLVPGNKTMGFEEVFQIAVGNVRAAWRVVADGALGITDDFETFFGNWDLDTGCDEAGHSVYWQAAS